MGIVVKESEREFTPAPEGLHRAVCVDVVDLGEEQTPWGSKHKIRVVWQVEELMPNGKPYLVSAKYTASLSEKANLRRDLESWRGKPLSQEELAGFDLEKLIGANCQLNVLHVKGSKGGTFANVATVVPIAKGMPKISPSNYTRVKDRTPEPSPPDEPIPADDENDYPTSTDWPDTEPVGVEDYR